MGRSNELFPYDELSFVVAWTALLYLYQIPVNHIPEVEYAVLENFKKLMIKGTVRPDWICLRVCAADFSLLNLPKGKSLGRSKPATNS
jgi:hypothetical protein